MLKIFISLKMESTYILKTILINSIYTLPVNVAIQMSRLVTKPTKWLCAERRLRSAWTSAQSEKSLRCALSG